MRAMVLDRPGARLRPAALPDPRPGPGQVLLRVCACAVCRTDLHVVDGELPDPKPCLVPGHEIVGRVVEAGPGAGRFRPGDRVGVPWLGFDLRRVPLLPRGPREPVRAGALHRLPDRRRLRRAGGRRRALLLRPAGRLRRRRGRAAALRRPDRPPRAADGRRGRAADRALRLRGGGAHRGAGGAARGAGGLRLHPPRRRRGAGASRGASARSGPAPRTGRRRSRWTPRSSSPRWAPWCRPRCAPWTAAGRWSAPAST